MKNLPARILALISGFAALLWFLIRVVPKPSRAGYPCQQMAFPIASAFVLAVWAGWAGIFLFLRRHSLSALAGVAVAAAGVAALSHRVSAQSPAAAAEAAPSATPVPKWIPATKPNAPIGKARGIFPGRVTWLRDVRATLWDGKTGRWWDEGNIDQAVLDGMFSKSLQALSGAKSDTEAWDRIIRYYNQSHGRGDAGRKPGESIAVKVNLNNTYGGYADADNDIDQSPQSVRTLLRQLTRFAGFAESDIVIYDSSPNGMKRAIPDRMFDPLHREFPGVRWMDCRGENGREAPQWVEGAIAYSSPETALGSGLPKQVVEATYLINFALLKGHEMSGVTLCGKNHFGSIQFPQKDHPKYVTPRKRDIAAQNALVDLMGSPNLGGKTILYILDGLYGTQTNVKAVTGRDRWKTLFGGEWSASYFLSLDPVAIDSVGLDFLYAEFGENLGFSGAKAYPAGAIQNCDNYLLEAARGTNKAFGAYKPNGKPTGSLGVHERWNNPAEKKYSRNLDPRSGSGIELVTVR